MNSLAQESTNFLLPNATFIAELVAFVIILWVLYKYVVPPLSKAMRERQDMIQRQIEDSEEAARKLRAAEERYDAALAEARTEAAKIRDGARADADRIRVELRGQAEQEVARIRQRGEEQLASEREQAVRALRAEIGQLSLQLAGRIVGQELGTDAARAATIDRFLADLDALPAQRDGAAEPVRADSGSAREDGG